MQGLKSNIRYWGYTLEYMLLVVLGMLLLICVMTGFDNLSNLHILYLEGLSDMGFLYIFLIVCIIAFSGAVSYFPFTLSMGSTRKNSFIGMQIALHLLEVQMVAVVLIAKAVLGTLDELGKVSYMLIAYVSALFIAIALGNFISATILRFGRTAGLIMYFLILVLVIGSVGVVVGMQLIVNIGGTAAKLLDGPIVMIGLVLDAVSIGIYYKVVRKLEVRV